MAPIRTGPALQAALFLASDAADYCTGQTYVMDGGLTMHWGGD